jgi:hypothetical protein
MGTNTLAGMPFRHAPGSAFIGYGTETRRPVLNPSTLDE